MSTSEPATAPPNRVAPAVIATLLHLPVGFYTLATGLLAPLWAVAAFVVIWIGALVWLIALLRSPRPWLAVIVPFANAAFMFLALYLGDVVLGWTA